MWWEDRKKRKCDTHCWHGEKRIRTCCKCGLKQYEASVRAKVEGHGPYIPEWVLEWKDCGYIGDVPER